MMGSSKTGVSNARTPKYTGMQLQTSAYGVPVPVVYGTTRLGWNLADYVNFQAHQKSSGKGGVVGGGGKGGGSTTYSASILGIVCEGLVAGIHSCWISQTQKSGTPGFSVFDGAIAQAPWSYLTSNYPAHAIGYSGFAYCAAVNYDLGSSANLPGINWEVQGVFQGTAPGTYGGNGSTIGGDADPSLIVPDILSNTQYGVGFPAARVGEVVSNSESHTVPTSGVRSITVNNAATFSFNVNVVDASGTIYSCASGAPGPLQYSFAAGVYTFNSAQSGVTVFIRYASVRALVSYQNFALASGLWVSPAYVDQITASAAIDDLVLATFSEVVWSSGILQIIPRGTKAISAHGYSYTPSSTPLFNLGEDDFLLNLNAVGTVSSAANDDPVIVTRSRASDQFNVIRIEFIDRANQYAPAIAEASDQALVDRYGRRVSDARSLHIFADLGAAHVAAQLLLQDENIRNSYSITLDERYGMLDPMDVVTLTDSQYPGLTSVAVRIREITENDDGTLSVVAEEYPGTVGAAASYSLNAGSGLIQNFDVDPGNAATPAIFDLPVGLVEKLGLETWLGTCSASGNPNWGGCDVYVSSDGTTYAKAGTLLGPTRMGTLTANSPAGSDPDTTNILSVDLSQSLGTLSAGTNANADNEDTVCFVDGEYISYSAATLTSTYHYNLGAYLRRGQGGSAIASHAAGSAFVRLDDGVFKLPYTPSDIGRTIHVKLVSFNIFGGGAQSLASVPSYTHTIGGPPAGFAPASLTLVAGIRTVQLNWLNPSGFGNVATEISRSASSAFSGAALLAVAGANHTSFVDTGVLSNTQYWYWIRSVDLSGNKGPYVPVSSGPGATTTTLQAQTSDVAPNAVSNNQAVSGGSGSLPVGSTAWITLGSVSITTSGGYVLVNGFATLSFPGAFTAFASYNWQLLRDGTAVMSTLITQYSLFAENNPLFYVDAPAGGTHTYSWQIQKNSVSSGSTNGIYSNASLSATEMKR